jgi:hypothetical protein
MSLATIAIDPEKKKNIENFVKSLRELDAAILPFQEHRKDLGKSYVENNKLTKDEVKLVKAAYNALKRKVNLDDLSTFVEIARKEVP